MAHKKGQGSSRNGRDSNPQYRGVKAFDTQVVSGGSILVRQVGTNVHAGRNVGMGKDHTLFAKISGEVKFTKRNRRQYVNIVPVEVEADSKAE